MSNFTKSKWKILIVILHFQRQIRDLMFLFLFRYIKSYRLTTYITWLKHLQRFLQLQHFKLLSKAK